MGLRGHEVSSASRRDVSLFMYCVEKHKAKQEAKQTAVFFNTINSKKKGKCLTVEAETKANKAEAHIQAKTEAEAKCKAEAEAKCKAEAEGHTKDEAKP